MRIQIRFFAVLRDIVGAGETSLEVPESATVAAAAEQIVAKFPALANLMQRVAFAVNQEYVKSDAPLHDGDELALIPPVSGG